MTEMDKLVEYLDKSGANYKRIKETNIVPFLDGIDRDFGRNQVIVYDDKGSYKWDAICQIGSYGYKAGLLEIMGDIVDEGEDGDSVAGWLTAENVIERVKAQEEVTKNEGEEK